MGANQKREEATAGRGGLGEESGRKPRVLIVGGGFAGLEAAKTLAGKGVRIDLVDPSNHHLFQPLLYQVATAALPAPSIAAPLRSVLREDADTRVLRAKVVSVDPVAKTAALDTGRVLHYDALILAAGSQTSYFGKDEWASAAPGLKTLADAQRIRRQIFEAFELAEGACGPVEKAKLLRFAIVGGGPTGVELAGAVAQIARHTLPGEFRSFNPADAKITLIDGGPRPLGPMGEKLGERARRDLEEMGVELVNGARVVSVERGALEYEKDGERVRHEAQVILWAAGVQANPLARAIGRSLGLEADRGGRLTPAADLSLPGAPTLFVAGDLAAVKAADGQMVPGLASAAKQMGRACALNALRAIRGEATQAFVWRDVGSMATIGRGRAVAKIGRWTSTGWSAWALWLFAHIWFLVGWRNRFMAFADWTLSRGAFGRGARAIWREEEPAAIVEAAQAMADAEAPGAARRATV
jgi:NADH:ubiquinone reductase (H+-translocating)